MKKLYTEIARYVESLEEKLFDMACDIFDNPEGEEEEYHASKLLTDYLIENGFAMELGIAGLPTAFRAVYEKGTGGPSIGFICEYDAIKGLGHVCGHHLQGPVCIGAALAVKNLIKDAPYKLVVYGTPAEETKGSKVAMCLAGCFKDIDVALSYHSGSATMVGRDMKALQPVDVVFHGKPSHASSAPENGRSALDAALLSFHGIECLREHILETSRIHYTMREGTGPTNTIHERAHVGYSLRASDKRYLEGNILPRFIKILDGACLMTETSYDITYKTPYYNMIPNEVLSKLAMGKARELELTHISDKAHITAGSTDVGNLSWVVPTLMMFVFYSREPSHSHAWLDTGKTEAACSSMVDGAKLFASMAIEMIEKPELVEAAKHEFQLVTGN